MIVPHESCENWVFELKMCPVDPRYLAHRICMNFPSAAKMQGSHWGCGYTRRASPDHLAMSSSFSSFPKEQTLPPFKHHWPSLPGTGQSWLLYSHLILKRYEVSLKRHTQYKSKCWKCLNNLNIKNVSWSFPKGHHKRGAPECLARSHDPCGVGENEMVRSPKYWGAWELHIL